ncbi:MAG: rhodanese-like domain-containing protein [Rhodospirillales bacterium]|jgi:rhodanese-related sulfurtransferase|nr:rhodanese-like domain-containing protein [Rhodospirillales bacterium]
MKFATPVRLLLVATVMFFAGQAADAADAKKFKAFHTIVDYAFMKDVATIPPRADALVVDSRPARKHDGGHIPGTLNISDSKFAKMTDLLPADKAQLLVFYCQGVKCSLSHKSAYKAEKLGYTNVKVYAAGYPDWAKNGGLTGVSTKFVKKLIDKKTDMLLVDSRPARKAKKGFVPTAIIIPDSQFKKMTDKLPADKGKLLVFYCGGLKCKLSPKSANKAIALGYTNVKVYQAGYPAWKKAYGAKKAAAIVAGPDGDTIAIASFEEILKNSPDSIHIIDVRDADEFAQGSFPGSSNIPVDELEAKIAGLPSDKPIVFVCATGARSGEAFDMVKMERDALKVFFLDAEITHTKGQPSEIKAAS